MLPGAAAAERRPHAEKDRRPERTKGIRRKIDLRGEKFGGDHKIDWAKEEHDPALQNRVESEKENAEDAKSRRGLGEELPGRMEPGNEEGKRSVWILKRPQKNSGL